MGEFFDLLRKIKNPEGVNFLNWALHGVQASNLQEFMRLPFCRQGLMTFLTVLTVAMRERFSMLGQRKRGADEELSGAHEFLKMIHTIAVKNGVVVTLPEVDVPLTEAGTSIAKGNMRVLNGDFVLTEKGQVLAEKTRAYLRSAQW